MSDIILVGGFSEIVELCQDCRMNIVGIIDKRMQGSYMGVPILGSDEDAIDLYDKYSQCRIVITPDSPELRYKLVNFYAQIGYKFATIISPEARVSRSAIIGEGCVIQAAVNISANTKIGDFVKVNTFANIMHDNKVGNFSTIAPNAVLLGRVSVGSWAYIGANCTLLPEVSIGDKAIVGAGAVVTCNVLSGSIVKGVPAK